MEPIGSDNAVEKCLLWGFLYVGDVGKNYGEEEELNGQIDICLPTNIYCKLI
jgi:hypothetical protein